MASSNHRIGIARGATVRPWLVATAAAIAALGFALAHTAEGNAAARKSVISTATTGLGKIIVDAQGRTLYLFQKDKNGKSACSGQCAAFWPPVIASGKPVAGPGVKASLLGTIKRGDGRMQVTYNHHPLYTFVKDTKKGQTSGAGVDGFGAEWFVVSPAGAGITKTTVTGGNGY
jgi:predicted lipoprotein with Yx(FWY)xxD motif